MDQPDKIYRYQKFSALSIGALCHDQLYFSEPRSFNDPLDCQPSVESDSNIDRLRLVLTTQIQQRVEAEILSSLTKAKVTGENSIKHAKEIAKQIAENELLDIKYNAKDPERESSYFDNECWLLTCEIERELLKKYDRGICCFTSNKYNPLLWSHYGDQHRGFCAGYDLNRKPKPDLHKVIYNGNRIVHTNLIAKAIIEEDLEYQKRLDENVLLRKAEPWSYEDEWRLFGKSGIQDSVLALKDITFGLRCTDAVRHSVIASLENRGDGINFYQIYQTRGTFDLEERLIDTKEPSSLPHTACSGFEVFGHLLEIPSEL